MRRFLATLTILGALAISTAGIALAADPHSPANPTGPPTGQPTQSCQAQPSAPGGGNSSQSSGSPFAGASSAGVYANGPGTGGPGTATGTGHITNPTAVSQYDVACFQNSQPGHP
jgi:hypothetical protein